jgi:glycosyltransferase involved in cell wall biosynthesis
MTHLFINALGASAGGGLTYVRNVIPQLAAHDEVRVTLAAGSKIRQDLSPLANVELLMLDLSPVQRFWFEQSRLGSLIQRSGAEVLVSTGNFSLRESPVPQILLSRNSIYTSTDYLRDLRRRHEYRAWADTRLRALVAKRSIRWADVTVAPSEAFAAELRRWTGVNVVAIHHGFDPDVFIRDAPPLSGEIEAKLRSADGTLKLLFVSHYNYYRNFETLIRALPLLREQISDRPVRLFLTCQLAPGKNPGAYRPDSAAALVKQLGVSDMVVELGSIPYQQLHHLYARADLYVTPAYTETFAHPLVEAMSCRLPVIASDIPVHREICGNAAVYFERFSAESLASAVARLARSREDVASMSIRGSSRANDFSWKLHVEKILALARTLTNSMTSPDNLGSPVVPA